MKIIKFISVIFFISLFLISNSFSKIVYIDLNKIMLDSDAGKSINIQIKSIENKLFESFKKREDELRDKETKIVNQKNLLSENEYKKKILSLKKDVDTYNNEKKNRLNNLNKKKKIATEQLIKNLNPILTKYMQDNLIEIIIRKQDIIVAKNDLEITDKIISLLNMNLNTIELKDD